uniref:T9SS type A sorting domain-containing protein n=3 Tax=Flavobacterium sp. TaxID=239 RepID=UPI00404B42FB
MKKLTLLLLLVSTSLFAQDGIVVNENLFGNWIINDVTLNGETFTEPEGNDFYKSWLKFNDDIFAIDYYTYGTFSFVDFPSNNSFTFKLPENPESEVPHTTLTYLLSFQFTPTFEQEIYNDKVEHFFCTVPYCNINPVQSVNNYTYTITSSEGITTLSILKENGDILNAIMFGYENDDLTTDWSLSGINIDGNYIEPDPTSDAASASFSLSEDTLLMNLNYCNDCYFTMEFISETEFIILENGNCTDLDCGQNYQPVASIFENSFWQNVGVENIYSYSVTTVDGIETLTITNPNGDQIIMQRVLASNESFENQTVSLFPNPVQNELFFTSESVFENYQIFDLTGKLLQKGNLSEAQNIAVQSLPKGLYVLQLENKNTQANTKFLKE